MASVIAAGTTSGTSLNLSADTSGVLQLATNGTTTAVTIDTSQRVGVGVVSPDGLITLPAAASNTPKIRLQSSTSDVDVTISSYADASGTYAAFGSNFYLDSAGDEAVFDATKRSAFVRVDGRVTGAVSFGTATTGIATERMRIDSSGNVGIGTGSPASLLHITGNDPTIRLTDNAGSPAATWSMRSTDGNFAIRDVTNSFDRATFNANGCMALTGANLTATGIGITFPATQSASSDANTLDDYEEGTWTPTVTAAASNPTVTYITQQGFYTKIGRMVSIQGRLQINTISGGSGAFRLSGLPFTNAAGITGAGTSWFSLLDLSAGYTMAGLYFSGNNNFLSIAQSGDNIGATEMNIGAILGSFDISFAFTYIV